VDHQLIAEARVAVPKKRATRSRAALMEALLVREITDQASVGYATFFRHFTDKDELLHDMAAGEISKLLTMTLPMLYTVETRPSTQALCAYVWSNRAIWSTLLTGGAAGVLKDEFNRQAQEVAIRHPKTDSGLPGDLAVDYCLVAAPSPTAQHQRNGSDHRPAGRSPLIDERMREPYEQRVLAVGPNAIAGISV